MMGVVLVVNMTTIYAAEDIIDIPNSQIFIIINVIMLYS